jgi:hypothetical protein
MAGTRIPRWVWIGNLFAIPVYSLIAAGLVEQTDIAQSLRVYVSIGLGIVAAAIAVAAWRFGAVAGSLIQIALFSPLVIVLLLAPKAGWHLSDLRDLGDPRLMLAISIEVIVPGVLLAFVVRALMKRRGKP